jgi:hypothetical protein
MIATEITVGQIWLVAGIAGVVGGVVGAIMCISLRRFIPLLMAAILAPFAAYGQEPQKFHSVLKRERVPSVAESVDASWQDASRITAFDAPSIRYVWCPSWMPANTPQIVSGVINLALSRSETIYQPVVARMTDGGSIVRYDARMLTADVAQLENLEITLGKLTPQEPYYHSTIAGVTAFSSHVGIAEMTSLAAKTQSQIPIVRADWFIVKALSTLDGGKYYDFQGIERNPKGKTAQKAWFDSQRASEAEIDAAQRCLIIHSLVAGRKWRRTDVSPARSARPGTAAGVVMLTHDISNEHAKSIASNPGANLIDFKDDAREAIGFKTNGLQQFALFKADGSLQDSAPENVVQDDEVPRPFTKQLQGAISCIRCHGPQDGYKPLVNDAPLLLSGRFDNFGDLLLANKQDAYQQAQTIAGLYALRPDKPISRARDDYQEAMYKATGGLGVKEFSAAVSTIYANYVYTDVTPRQALLELGVVADDASAPIALQNLLGDTYPLEDVRVATLKKGGTLSRADWELIYGDAASRALITHN